jgi:hypothetical protein
VAIRVAVETYLTLRRDKAPEELLDLVALWTVLARMQLKKEAAEDAPPPPPGPPGPGAPPMLPPGAPPPGAMPPPPPGAPPMAPPIAA